MAKNPDPLLPITSYGGKTRTLDDWATVFNLAIVVLPDRPEGASFLGIVDRIFATFGDSDVRTIICVPTTPAIAKRSRAGARRQPRAGEAPGLRAPSPRHDARERGAGLEPERMAKACERDRTPRELDVTNRVGSGRPQAHAGLADRQLIRPDSVRARGRDLGKRG